MTLVRQPIDRGFNVAVQHIASRLFPTGFDVSMVESEVPSRLATLTAHIRQTGRMLVWGGASELTCFACPETNAAFRAWHDWCHWKLQAPFTEDGERECAAMQQAHLATLYGIEASRRWRLMIHIEVNAQLAYAQVHDGEFPVDQWAFMATWLTRFNVAGAGV